ncbi:hydroxyphenylacetyl-CoA thioesterase PaaI [Actibacterium lipolyticum]|uniref:Acyl-coenzyme A thioesterase PaaI n=1 Tax=Actibacterium lipolyticum TaxID=1524263 RepID=A0A238L7M0_9RHOB|nr:hydroxyphenylacetyl-CoA thioesterase PaaI [Actibacterium lipolyticum]SMX51093.1 Acyl-coenzyme A thioesterase PaaI [Actibacterium lipolyticum]
MGISAKERAERSAEAMWRDDGASQWVGLELLGVDEGFARIALVVQAHHANGHGMCHGGVIFTLADSAFAFACNSYNQVTVAQHNSITYIAPGRVGDRLIATATEVSRTGRSGIYDVSVHDPEEKLIASFRGLSRTIGGALFEE